MGLFSSLFGGKKETPARPEPEANEDEAPGIPLEELREALDSPDGGLRVDAARALIERWRGGDAQAAEAIAPRLPELLDDGEALVRLAAVGGVRLRRKCARPRSGPPSGCPATARASKFARCCSPPRSRSASPRPARSRTRATPRRCRN
jgi:hypothetical protein